VRVGVARSFVATTVLFGAACSLFTSLNGLANGDTNDASPEASPSIAEAGGTVAAPDAARCDGSFCECLVPKPAQCDDFERGGTFNGRWSDSQKYNATLRVGPGGVSSPNALLVETDLNATDVSTAYLSQDVPTVVTEIELTFDMRIDRIAKDSDTAFAQIDVHDANPNGFASIGFGFSRGAFELSDYTKYPDGGVQAGKTWPLESPTLGQWRHYQVKLSLTGAPGVVVTIDGKNVIDERVSPGFAPAAFTMHCPIEFATPSATGWAFAFDNLTLDYK
jgi:hypothetical protein